MKTRTCKRCNGSGFRNTGVLHLGVPGLCYGCNGSGCQRWVDASAITAEREIARERHIEEIKQTIADCKTGYVQGTIRERFYTQWTNENKALLQAVTTTAVEPATKGEWRPASRNTEKASV